MCKVDVDIDGWCGNAGLCALDSRIFGQQGFGVDTRCTVQNVLASPTCTPPTLVPVQWDHDDDDPLDLEVSVR